MKIKSYLIRKLGGIVKEELPKDVADSLIEIQHTNGKVEFIREPDLEDEEDALEEINTPAWKQFINQFKIK